MSSGCVSELLVQFVGGEEGPKLAEENCLTVSEPVPSPCRPYQKESGEQQHVSFQTPLAQRLSILALDVERVSQ